MTSFYMSSSKTMTLSDVLNRKSVQAKRESAASQISAVLPKFVPFVPPSVSKCPDAELLSKGEALRQFIGKMPGMTYLNPINSQIKGLQLPDGPAPPTVVNPMMTFTNGGHDGTMINAINSADIGNVSVDFRRLVLEEANKHYSGTGTQAGLFFRMQSQLTKREDRPPSEEDLQFLLRAMPKSGRATLTGEGTTSIAGLDPEFNPDAHPGAPYFKGGVTMLDESEKLLAQAQALLNVLSTEGANGLVKYLATPENVPLATMILCPKRDVYLREEYFLKVRPFGIPPGALKLLFLCIAKAIDPYLQNFLENEESCSAFKFSWLDGGAEKLWAWVTKDLPGFRALSWGDDQYWTVQLKDGTKILLNPDVAGMDMKIKKEQFLLFRAWLFSCFSTAPVTLETFSNKTKFAAFLSDKRTLLNSLWANAIMFFVHYLYSHPLLTAKHYMFLQGVGLLSGIPMTTIIDLTASMQLINRVRVIPLPPKAGTPEDPHHNIKLYLKEVRKVAEKAGFPLKPIQYQVLKLKGKPTLNSIFDEDGKEHPQPPEVLSGLTFLGMKIVRYTFPAAATKDHKPLAILVPAMDPLKAMVHAVYNGIEEKDPLVKAGKCLASLFGQGMGVFTHPDAFRLLGWAWYLRRRQGQVPLLDKIPVLEGMDLPEEALNTYDYPPREWYARHFASQSEKEKVPPITLAVTSPTLAAQEEFIPAVAKEDADLLDAPVAEPAVKKKEIVWNSTSSTQAAGPSTAPEKGSKPPLPHSKPKEKFEVKNPQAKKLIKQLVEVTDPDQPDVPDGELLDAAPPPPKSKVTGTPAIPSVRAANEARLTLKQQVWAEIEAMRKEMKAKKGKKSKGEQSHSSVEEADGDVQYAEDDEETEEDVLQAAMDRAAEQIDFEQKLLRQQEEELAESGDESTDSDEEFYDPDIDPAEGPSYA